MISVGFHGVFEARLRFRENHCPTWRYELINTCDAVIKVEISGLSTILPQPCQGVIDHPLASIFNEVCWLSDEAGNHVNRLLVQMEVN